MLQWPIIAVIAGAAIVLGVNKMRPRTVLAIGDSLTANGGYCKALENRLPKGSSVFCVGYPGAGVKAIRKAVNVADQKGATDIIILAGVNDLASGRDAQDIADQLELLYKEARATGARVIAVNLTPWAGHFIGKKKIAETIKLNILIHTSSIPSYRINTSALGKGGVLKDEYDSGDGLHLNSAGQTELANIIYRQVF